MNKTQKRIEKRVYYWQDKLGLKNWDIVVKFSNKYKHPNQTDIFRGLARTQSDSQYLMGNINFTPTMLKMVDDETIVHELLHCLMSETFGYFNSNYNKQGKNWVEYYQENIISQLARIILRK